MAVHRRRDGAAEPCLLPVSARPPAHQIGRLPVAVAPCAVGQVRGLPGALQDLRSGAGTPPASPSPLPPARPLARSPALASVRSSADSVVCACLFVICAPLARQEKELKQIDLFQRYHETCLKNIHQYNVFAAKVCQSSGRRAREAAPAPAALAGAACTDLRWTLGTDARLTAQRARDGQLVRLWRGADDPHCAVLYHRR